MNDFNFDDFRMCVFAALQGTMSKRGLILEDPAAHVAVAGSVVKVAVAVAHEIQRKRGEFELDYLNSGASTLGQQAQAEEALAGTVEVSEEDFQ